MRTSHHIVIATAFALACGAAAFAQESPSQPARPAAADVQKLAPVLPLKVTVVLSRYQGDKKVSSLPYSLAVIANEGTLAAGQYHAMPALLRMGAQVPVPTAEASKGAQAQGAAGSVYYKSIGTNIDSYAWSTDNTRFRVYVSIEDTSVYGDGQTAQGTPKFSDIPSFRTFRSSNTVILSNGQSTEYTAAADKITGEVTKVEVTLTVEK